jgi:HK97 family phage major capsid protein
MQYVASGVDGVFKGDKLYELVASLKTGYREKACFVASRATFSTIRQIKAGEGAYLFAPSADGPATLLGFPCVDCEDMPVVATDAYPLAFGDFGAGYQIADRGAIKMLRDPFTTKGSVLFYATKRVGGGVVNSEAIKFAKLSVS